MTSIAHIRGRPILDSRGAWTIEAALTLSDGTTVRASVPNGKSIGFHEARYVPLRAAIRAIEKVISPKIKGKDPRNQKAIDDLLISLDHTPEKSRLGANTLLAVSVAVLRAGAILTCVPLWKHVRMLGGFGAPAAPPRLLINVINGGLHAGNNLRFQEYLAIPRATTIARSVLRGLALYRTLGTYLAKQKGESARNVGDEGGYAPDYTNDFEPLRAIRTAARAEGFASAIDLGLDAAASNVRIPQKTLHSIYTRMVKEYGLLYLEDPFSENNWKEFASLTKETHAALRIAGDDLTVTNIQRMKKAQKLGAINAVIIKPNQIGTVSEAIEAVTFAKKTGWFVVASHRSGETNDDFIADFAYGVGADGIKLGAPARGERIAKYNRLLEIEQTEDKK